jgi:hypothetical protein
MSSLRPCASPMACGGTNGLVQRSGVRAQALLLREHGRLLARLSVVMSACSASLVTASCRVVTVMGSMTRVPPMRRDSSVWWRDQTPL